VTYAIASLEPQSNFRVPRRRMGPHDDRRLILSDGFSKSRSWIPRLSSSCRFEVFDSDTRAENLNELEFGGGKIYANVLAAGSNRSHSAEYRGQVTGWIDVAELEPRMPPLPTRASASRNEWYCLRLCGSRAVCDGQAMAKSFSDLGAAAVTLPRCNCGSVDSRRLRTTNRAVIPDFRS
jgi:hypothetical protein